MEEIMTLEELVRYINACDTWELDISYIYGIIKDRGWRCSDVMDENVIAIDCDKRIVFDGEKAVVETKPVIRMLFPTKEAALSALRESGKEGYRFTFWCVDGHLKSADGFQPPCTLPAMPAMRTDDGDVFAWWDTEEFYGRFRKKCVRRGLTLYVDDKPFAYLRSPHDWIGEEGD